MLGAVIRNRDKWRRHVLRTKSFKFLYIEAFRQVSAF